MPPEIEAIWIGGAVIVGLAVLAFIASLLWQLAYEQGKNAGLKLMQEQAIARGLAYRVQYQGVGEFAGQTDERFVWHPSRASVEQEFFP